MIKLWAYQHVRLAGSLEHPCVGHRLSHDVPPDTINLVWEDTVTDLGNVIFDRCSPCWTSSPQRASASWCPRCWRSARGTARTLGSVTKRPECPVEEKLKLCSWPVGLKELACIEISLSSHSFISSSKGLMYAELCMVCAFRMWSSNITWQLVNTKMRRKKLKSYLNIIHPTEDGHPWLPVGLTSKSHLWEILFFGLVKLFLYILHRSNHRSGTFCCWMDWNKGFCKMVVATHR